MSERPWPPLIEDGAASRWVLARDVVLTALMWFLFLLLLIGEIERLVEPWLARLGIPLDVKGVGYADLAGNWHRFLYSLAPYLGIALLLVIALVSFAIETIDRRRRALRGPKPPPLPLGVEARHAELATVGTPVGAAVEARRSELALVEAVDARAMLTILGQLDQAALTDTRTLKVTQVHLTPSGHYRIEADR